MTANNKIELMLESRLLRLGVSVSAVSAGCSQSGVPVSSEVRSIITATQASLSAQFHLDF